MAGQRSFNETRPAIGRRTAFWAWALPVALVACTDAQAPDAPISGSQGELLDLAFSAATAIPVNPQIKSRSRAQAAVVTAALELDQPRRARGYAEGIDNWLRGLCYADLAYYCAERQGDTAEVRSCLDMARSIAEESAAEENAQTWRSGRVLSRIASVYLLLGEDGLAGELAAGIVDDSEVGEVQAARAVLSDPGSFDDQVRVLDATFATGNFEQVQNALETCARLLDKYYEDAERRGQMQKRVETSYQKLPVLVRVQMMMRVAESALDHEDPGNAIRVVGETQALLESETWLPEDHIPLIARLAELRFRAGDESEAHRELDRARAMFDENRDKIVNIYRAGALRPVAEAFCAIEDTEAALTVYREAIEEGVENPNSTPRAEDLSATCISMALHGFEPDRELMTRIRGIHDGLDDPW